MLSPPLMLMVSASSSPYSCTFHDQGSGRMGREREGGERKREEGRQRDRGRELKRVSETDR